MYKKIITFKGKTYEINLDLGSDKIKNFKFEAENENPEIKIACKIDVEIDTTYESKYELSDYDQRIAAYDADGGSWSSYGSSSHGGTAEGHVLCYMNITLDDEALEEIHNKGQAYYIGWTDIDEKVEYFDDCDEDELEYYMESNNLHLEVIITEIKDN